MDINASLQTLLANFLLFLPKLITALVTLVVVLLLASLAARSVEQGLGRRPRMKNSIQLLSQLARWSILAFGLVLVLEQVNFNVVGFVAGLGIAGFTIGFALQDIARNFVAGIILIIRQPFRIGDSVKVVDYTGTVIEINLRDTVIRTWDGEKVILPNQAVYGAAIVNYSDLPVRRRTVTLRIDPHADIVRARMIFQTTLASIPGVLAKPGVSIQVEGLNGTGIQLVIYFWVNQTQSDLSEVQSVAVQALWAAAAREKISLI